MAGIPMLAGRVALADVLVVGLSARGVDVQFRSDLQKLLRFAARQSRFYRNAPWAARARNLRTIDLRDVAITPKSIVKDHTAQFYCENLPTAEGATFEKFTSGSTGDPVRLLKTDRHFQMNAQENQRLREAWSVQGVRNVLRVLTPRAELLEGSIEEDAQTANGSSCMIRTRDYRLAARMIAERQITELHTFPSVALGILEAGGDFSSLRLISTISETVPEELRMAVAQYPRLRHRDSYGTKETGIIGVSCPMCGEYHVADRHLVFEALSATGEPVGPGESGRVTVTPLYNYAMPLLRYEVGDTVVMSQGRKCPLGVPVFARVEGRLQHRFTLPDGTKVAPVVDPAPVRALGIRQVKLVQINRAEVEVRYISFEPETTLSAVEAQAVVDRAVSSHLRAISVKVASLPPAPSGKYIQHESFV